MADERLKLRLRLQNGMEFEVEGNREFVQSQREAFLIMAKQAVLEKNGTDHAQNGKKNQETPLFDWAELVESKNGVIYLRTKSPDIGAAETALLILAAWAQSGNRSMDALKLAKSIKKSGFSRGRLDRILNEDIRQARIIPAGTKRARHYRLSQEGLARATYLAQRILQ
jgi:hypothetical protein